MIGLIMLVVFVLYLLVAISVTRWLARIPKRSSYKWLIALLTLAVFALIPTWDEILGRMYFKHLCETGGGVRVYRIVELGPEFFDDKGFVKKDMLASRYEFPTLIRDIYSPLLNIHKETNAVGDKATGQTLGSHVYFIYFGGWLVNRTGLHVSGTSCPKVVGGNYQRFLNKVFTR